MSELIHTLKALLSHYWRYPWQALFLLVGLCAGVALWSAVHMINSHARSSYQEADQLLGLQAHYWIRAQDGQGVALADYIALRRQGLRMVYPIVQGQVTTAQGLRLMLIATDPIAIPLSTTPSDSGGTGVGVSFDSVAFIQAPFQAWFPQTIADELQITPQQRLQLADGQVLPPAVIQSRPQQGRQVLLDIAPALRLLRRDTLSYLAVGTLTPSQHQALVSALPTHLKLVENRQRFDLTQLTASLHTQLNAMSLLSFAVGLFIVFNAVRFSLWYRRPTLRTLRLLGISVKTLALAIGLETLIWSIIGTGLGLIMGWGLSHALLPTVSASLNALYDANLGNDLVLNLHTGFWAWLLTLGGLVLALAMPLWQQLRLAVLPSHALSDHWYRDAQARRYLAWVALLLTGGAGLMYPLIQTLTQGFVLLGLVLLASAWVLPWLLGLVLTGLEYLLPKGFRTKWLIRDGFAQLPASRTAMMALLLALTANVGVETLVGSFRTALAQWLEQRLAADIYVQSNRHFELDKLITLPETGQWLRATHQRTHVEIRWNNQRTQLRGMDTDAPDSQSMTLTQALPNALALWSAAENQQPNLHNWLLANEQLHYLGGIRVGERIQLDTLQGKVSFTIAGFVHDYGNPYFQLQFPNGLLAAYWQPEPWNTALWLHQPMQLKQAETALLQVGAKAGDWVEQSTVKDLSMKIFERTFAMTTALNTLTLGVAGIALLAALLAILQERLPEFAQWQALGVTARERWAVMSLPLVVWVSITWLCALPLGALLSWLLIHKLNVMAFGWSMPLLWSMTPVWQLAVLTLGVVFLTLLIVNWQLKRQLPQALSRLGALN